jgi:hypothetical protein
VRHHRAVRLVVAAIAVLSASAVVAACSDDETGTAASSTTTVRAGGVVTTSAPLATSPTPTTATPGATGPRSLQDSTTDRLVAAGFAPAEASCIGSALFVELAGDDLTAALEALAPLGPDGAPLPVDEAALDPVASEILRSCRA